MAATPQVPNPPSLQDDEPIDTPFFEPMAVDSPPLPQAHPIFDLTFSYPSTFAVEEENVSPVEEPEDEDQIEVEWNQVESMDNEDLDLNVLKEAYERVRLEAETLVRDNCKYMYRFME